MSASLVRLRLLGQPTTPCDEAAHNGELKQLRSLVRRGYWCTEEAGCHAAMNGHVNILQFLCEHELLCRHKSEVTEIAASHGSLSCLKYLHKQGVRFTSGACDEAASGGHFACLKFLHKIGVAFTCTTAMRASEMDLEVLKCVRAKGCPWDEYVYIGAAMNGKFDCFEWAHENGCPWTADTTRTCCCFGKFEMLRYARERGCAMCEDPMWWAASSGNVDCLKYLHADGCALGSDTYEIAVLRGMDDECVRFLHKKRCPWNREIAALRAATRRAVYWPKLRAAWQALLLTRFVLYKLVPRGAQYELGGRARKRDRDEFEADSSRGFTQDS